MSAPDMGQTAEALRQWVEATARTIAVREVERALVNRHATGADAWVLNGVTASTTVPWGLFLVPYAATIQWVELAGFPLSSPARATVDIRTAGPGRGLLGGINPSEATSIVGSDPPTIVDAERKRFAAGGTWSPIIDPGTWVVVYLTECTGYGNFAVAIVPRLLG